MRSVQMTIATTMLAVPASAFALTGSTSASGHSDTNPIQLQVSPRRVQFGDAVSVTGTAPVTDAGRRVVLETTLRRTSAWRQVAATRTGRHGGFRFRAALRHSGLLRVREQAGQPAATAAAAGRSGGPATSALRPVTVAARFRLIRHQFAVLSGSSVHVGGKLLPALRGRQVRLQVHSGAGWRNLAVSRTGRLGGFRLGYVPSSGIARRLRLAFSGDRGNSRSVHPAGAVTVYRQSEASWYNDGGATACGFHAGLGVANRSLPCGTKVGLRYGGHSVTAVVDDRGPYVGGRSWDLNQSTAAALGFSGVGTVWATS
jgi:rare lipoprotein A